MSRIILTRFDDGQEHIVVGWDHPGGGCWWQEFNQEKDDKGVEIWKYDESWEEVKGFGGYMPGIPTGLFREQVPMHIKPMITDEVMRLIKQHMINPNSGKLAPIDLSEQARAKHDADIMEGIRQGNLADDL